MEETGVVTLSARYAQVGVPMTATLTDDDVEDPGTHNRSGLMPLGNGTKVAPEQPKPRALAMLQLSLHPGC